MSVRCHWNGISYVRLTFLDIWLRVWVARVPFAGAECEQVNPKIAIPRTYVFLVFILEADSLIRKMSHKQKETVSGKWSPPIHFCRFAFVTFVLTNVVILVAYRGSARVLTSETPPRPAESEQLVTNSENVSPNTPNQPTKPLKPPTSSDSSHAFDYEKVGWVNVGPEMWVYSAYLDTRADSAYFEKWGVVVVAVQKIQTNQPSLYCLLTDNKGHTLCLKHPIRRVLVNNNSFKHRPYYYVCNLPSNFSIVTLKFVSFSFNRSCQQPSPPIPVTQVQTTSNPTKGFGVCIESPLFNMNDVQFIIQTIEMNRILGAEWFTFYVHSASQDVIQVLQDYAKEGVVEVVMSTIPKTVNVYYHGQQVVIQDCAYRNMYKVKYLLFTDLDEIIVPQKHRNWSQLLTAMDNKSLGEFQVRHVAFSGKSVSKTLSVCNSSKEIERPRFMKFTERSPPNPLPKRAKLIIKPETFAIIVTHGLCQLLKDYSTYAVPSDVALLYHYRLRLRLGDSQNRVKDDRMLRYFPELIDRIEEQIC